MSSRKKDIAQISREQIVDPESNYCFGEGGAGTYSDGKLYTRSKKRGDNTRVLELLCLHGANENILYEAHPHLGTDKLPGIISEIRKSILDAGGLFMLEKKVTDFLLKAIQSKELLHPIMKNSNLLMLFLPQATLHAIFMIYAGIKG